MLRTKTIALTTLCAAAMTANTRGAIADLAADYDVAHNPSATGWSYGYKSTVTGALTLFTFGGLDSNGDFCWSLDSTLSPDVEKNVTGHAFGSATYNYPAGAVTLGPSGLYAVIRWTAPSAGLYDVVAHLDGFYSNGGATQVSVVAGSTVLSQAVISGQQPNSYAGEVFLNAGDTLDFVDGATVTGSASRVFASATITAVPEPGMASAAAGIACAALLRRRRI